MMVSVSTCWVAYLEVMLTLPQVRPLSALNQPMGVRATVNILNPPYGQDGNDYIGIIKHFEVPASSSNSTATDQLASAQYGDSTMPGRSAIIA